MRKFIASNWYLFIPLGAIVSPFYLGVVRMAMKLNGFDLSNDQLLGLGVTIGCIVLFSKLMHNMHMGL